MIRKFKLLELFSIGIAIILLSSCEIYSSGKTYFHPHEKIIIEPQKTHSKSITVTVHNYSDKNLTITESSDSIKAHTFQIDARTKKKFKIPKNTQVTIENNNQVDMYIHVVALMFFQKPHITEQ